MRKDIFIKVIKNLIVISILICMILSAILVGIANKGGRVCKFFSYSAVAVLEDDKMNFLEKNDLIIFKDKDTYEREELVWYFISPSKTDINRIKQVERQKESTNYILLDKKTSEIEYMNIIGSKKYKISNIGKYIVFIQNIPWYITLVSLIALLTALYYLVKEKENNKGVENNV